ncbi:MAG: hypothetical protein FJ109_08945 [Deltaproteobacteria bacterium]|nr:hypothetical protein [Deltaproteobacteria bacterium]
MRSALAPLFFVSVALALSGCPLSGGGSEQEATDSAGLDVPEGTPAVVPDGLFPDVTGQNDVMPTTDGVSPELVGVPCIAASPGELDFGGVQCMGEKTLVLAIESCGGAPLEVYDIGLSPESHPAFSLDLSGLAHEPTLGVPLTIAAGAAISVQVVFAPTSPSPVDDAGQPVLFKAAVLVGSNAGESPQSIQVHGAGVTIEAPVAVIQCQEGSEVVPGTVLHLSGNKSYQGCETEGAITKLEWDVARPQGSAAQFEPSASVADPTFLVDLAGIYTFYLVVYDESNTPSCFPAEYQVWVIPQAHIHIELFWHTPSDTDDPSVGPGADLDLHLQHPFGFGYDHDGDGQPDCWMDVDANCFWFNPNPDWGEPGPGDDPMMLFNDQEGTGPEVISFDNPEALAYLVGVYYYDDHGAGGAWATVRLFLSGQLVFEVSDVQLAPFDIWTVFRIDWPTGDVTPVTDEDGGYAIQPDFKEGYFGGDPEICGPF